VTGTFSLTSEKDESVFFALLTGPVAVVAGYGGWNKVARPRRKALTEWQGRDPMSLEIPFTIDRLADGAGGAVEGSIRILEKMAGIDAGDPQPPTLRLQSYPSGLIPHGFGAAPHVRWVIETLGWDREQTIINAEGQRVRQNGTITITQFVEDVHLRQLSIAGRGKARKGRKRVHVVKKGDTLGKIALKYLGSARKWKQIAKLNKIRDPKRIKIGQRLKLP